MLAVLLSTLLLAFLVLTFGHAAKTALRLEANAWDTAFLGIAAVNTVCAWASLAVPVGTPLLVAMLLTAGVYAYRLGKVNRAEPLLGDLFRSIQPTFWVLFLLACFIATEDPRNPDTPLYHLQSIMWYEQYPVVPGLGNLHGRLAFNQNVFLLFSLTSLKDLFGQEIFSVNLLVFVIYSTYILKRLRDIHALQGFTPVWFFYLLLGIFVFRMPNLSSPSPDNLSQILSFYIFTRVVDMYLDGKSEAFDQAPVLLLLGFYTFTVKLSAAPMPLLFLVLLLYRTGPGLMDYLRLVPAVLLMFIPWIARNVIMSGWLVFPFPSLDLFSFDWKVPLEDVQTWKILVTGWARMAGEDNYLRAYHMSFSEWFPIWFRHLPKTSMLETVLIVLGFLVPVIGFAGMLLGRVSRSPVLVSILLTCILGIFSWLMLGPTFRFGAAVITVSAFSFLLFMRPVTFGTPSFLKTHLQTWVIGLLAVMLMLRNTKALEFPDLKKPVKMTRLLKPDLVPIKGQSYELRKASNFEYFQPRLHGYCYDCSIPCTPIPDSTLALRGGGLRQGFRKTSVGP